MIFSKIEHLLTRYFSPSGFREHMWLRVVFFATLAHSILLFTSWRNTGILTQTSLTRDTFSCWPYLQSCEIFAIFNDMPLGYSLGILYAVLGGILLISFIAALHHHWSTAIFALFLITCFKIFAVYIGSATLPTNYNALAIYVSLLIIFSRNRIFALKVVSTVFYLCALVNKIHEGYIQGDVFTSLSLGVPFIPDMLLPYLGILFMAMLITLPILLWSPHLRIRLGAGIGLTVFHLSTIAIVGFIYPLLCIPLVLLTALSLPDSFTCKKVIADPALFVIIIIMVVGQVFALFIPGDNRLTAEGTRYGFYMYEANHQCTGYLEHKKRDGDIELTHFSNGMAMGVCDPYILWFQSRALCKEKDTTQVSMYFKHSINGGPYYELVREENICSKEYRVFQHNEWIRLDSPLPTRPNKNSFLLPPQPYSQ